jgi:small subunit ribosomal protein S9
METNKALYFRAIGRRKSAVARIKIVSGNGKIDVNGAELTKYFPTENLIRIAQHPLKLTNTLNKYDVSANLDGGGYSGQAGAMSLGISRALLRCEPALRPQLKKAGLLSRDPREKERKKYGQRGARRRFQFSKR